LNDLNGCPVMIQRARARTVPPRDLAPFHLGALLLNAVLDQMPVTFGDVADRPPAAKANRVIASQPMTSMRIKKSAVRRTG